MLQKDKRFSSTIIRFWMGAFVFLVALVWIYSGYPVIWDNPRIPPEISIVLADTALGTYSFASNSQGWSNISCGASGSTCAWESSDGSPANGSLQESEARKNKSGTWVWEISGITWETLGVPSGATVTAVDGSYNHRMSTCVTCGTSNTSGDLLIRDSGDSTTIATLETAVSYSVATSWAARNAAGTQSVGASYQASNTGIIIRLTGYLGTPNTQGAQAVLRQDEVSLTITYTPSANVVPTISVAQPDGTDDTVVVGSSYNITYTLADPDDTVTAAFYYDTDTDMSGGTAISGACASAAEGTGATCAWDTSGVSAGSYYVYGVADDGTNPAESAISSGQITIIAVSVSITLDQSSFDYGTMSTNTASSTLEMFSGSGIIATNEGNVIEDFTIYGADTAAWTLAGTTDADQYIHRFCNDTDNDCTSPPTNYTALTTSPVSLKGGIAVSGTVNFQLSLTTPSSDSSDIQQSAVITIQAAQQ